MSHQKSPEIVKFDGKTSATCCAILSVTTTETDSIKSLLGLSHDGLGRALWLSFTTEAKILV